jgi:hypothetical protein
MKSLSLCQQLGGFCLLLAVCVLAAGCGSSGVDALVKEQKAIQDELKNSIGDEAKFKAAMVKQGELTRRVMAQPFQRRRLSMSGIPSYSDWTDLCERSP